MKIIVDNLSVEYDDQGQGPSILMLHGWKDSLHGFDPLISELIKQYRAVRLDLPGFGGSETPKDVWNLEKYVQFVSAFLKKLDIKPEVFVGHSMGGRICIKGFASGEFSAEKLVLISSAGVADRKTLRNSLFKLLAKTGKVITLIPPFNLWRGQLRKTLYKKAGSDYLDAGRLKKTFLKIISEDLSEQASHIRSQTLLVWGKEDAETPIEEANKLSRLIKNSKLVSCGGAGHFVHLEKAQDVAGTIIDFIK